MESNAPRGDAVNSPSDVLGRFILDLVRARNHGDRAWLEAALLDFAVYNPEQAVFHYNLLNLDQIIVGPLVEHCAYYLDETFGGA